MRKLSMGLAAAAAVSVILAGCSSGDSESAPAESAEEVVVEEEAPAEEAPAEEAPADAPYIAIVSKGFQHQFWQAVKAGAEQAAGELGVTITFDGPASESEVEAQMNMLTAALAKQPAALGFAALDSKAAGSVLQQFADAGIPVIAFDSGVDSDIPLTTAATDNKVAAAEAAKHMCELIGNKGKVGLVVHDQVSKSGTDRRDGFLEGLAANCPDVEVLEPQYGGGDQAKSADIVKSMLAANPDIAGIFGSNEGSAIGAVKGVEEAGAKGKVVLVGFDSGKAQTDAIRSGLMAGAITQDPVGMGQELVKSAVAAINGESLPGFIDTGFYWYDATNIDDPEIAAVLYE